MTLHLVTGHTGAPHVSSDDQRHQNAILHGSGAYIVSGCNCTMTNANTAHISSGLLMVNGAFIRITGAGEDVAVQSGVVGQSRTDYIVLRYEAASGGVESVSLVCKKGQRASGGNILDGDALAEFELYSINIDGVNVGTPAKVMADFSAKEAFGLGSLAYLDSIPDIDASKIASGVLSDARIPVVPVSKGGTGATTASAARTALGLGTAAVTSPGDYVTEQGVSNGCYYIKWNSGNCMMYARKTLSSPCNTAWGSMYESSAIQISWPFTLQAAPYEIGMVSGSGNASLTEVSATGDGTATTSKKYNQVRPTSSNSQTLALVVFAFGRWK